MKTKNLFRVLSLLLCAINFVSCQKEEWDVDSRETEQSTVVEGVVVTSGSVPLANVKIRVDYSENKWLAYAKTRHKAEATTDKNGKYRLFFSIKDDELETEKDKELGVSKNYLLIFDMERLNSKEYIMPSDMVSTVISVDPPIAHPAEKVNTRIDYYGSFERKKTYEQNLYIPQKRFIQVTLKGFVPQPGDYFEVCNAFPYGGESVTDHLFPNTNYGYAKVDNFLFALYDAQERTYQVPCALNENNIITINRKKNGVYSQEEHQLFVTKDSPQSLTFEY